MARALAMSPDNLGWKRSLATYQDALANFPSWQAKFEIEAAFQRGDYTKAAATQAKLTALVENARPGQGGKPGKETADAFLELAWYRLFARDFKGALAASEHGIAIQPNMFELATNKAHALMFLGRAQAARALYLRYKGRALKDNGKLWEQTVLDDFKEFEEHGLKHRQMAEIKALLAAK
jgi:tetratricopeptide (TPR) repeat protein